MSIEPYFLEKFINCTEKAAYGALIGFFTGVFLKLIIGLAFAYIFIKKLWDFWF